VTLNKEALQVHVQVFNVSFFGLNLKKRKEKKKEKTK
jgi:hypothetical protein